MINDSGAYRFVDREQTYKYKFFVPHISSDSTYSSMSLVLSNKPNVTYAELEKLLTSSNIDTINSMGFVEVCQFLVYADCTVDDHGRYAYQGNTYNYIYQFFD